MRIAGDKIAIREEMREFLADLQWAWYGRVFDRFDFGIYDRVMLLCQIYPFNQFLDADGKELRTIKKRKRSKNGNYNTKRVGLNRFHAHLGKAVKPWSSGNKTGSIVTGSSLMRERLYPWVNFRIVIRPVNNPDPILDPLFQRYAEDCKQSNELLDVVKAMQDDDLESLLRLLNSHHFGSPLLPIVQTAIEKKRSPITTVSKKGKACLTAWAKARVADKAVKLLFKALVGEYRIENR